MGGQFYFVSWQGQNIFLFQRPALGATKSPFNVCWGTSLHAQWLRGEADHLPPLTTGAENVNFHQNTPASLVLNHIYGQIEMPSMTCDLQMHIVWRVHNKYVLLLFSEVSRLAVELTQPTIRWVSGVSRPAREADHSPLLVPRLRMSGALPSSPTYKS